MIDLRVPKHEVSEFGWGYDKVDRVVSALRLTHAGRVGYGYYMEIENSPPDDSLGTPISWSTVFPDFSGEVYMLLDVQEEQLRTVFRRLEGIAEVAFERALSRFNRIYERRSNADRLIDCWVALEALFLGDLGQGELSYRACVRIAHFIETTPDAREATFVLLRKSYAARSKVVHGDEVPNLETLTDDTEEVCRRCLRMWIDPEISHDMTTLDRSVLRGSS